MIRVTETVRGDRNEILVVKGKSYRESSKGHDYLKGRLINYLLIIEDGTEAYIPVEYTK